MTRLRGGPPRNIHVAAAAAPRPSSEEDLRGISTSRPRRRRDPLEDLRAITRRPRRYGQWWRDRGLSDIGGHAELIARTHEFGGRVVRLLYALENDLERKEGTVALVSARTSLKGCLDAKLCGPVADAALAQTRALAAMGNLRTNQPRLMHANPELLTPEQRFALQGGRKPRAKSASRGQRRLAG